MLTDFTGTGKRLQQGEIGAAAKKIGIATPVLLAFLEVEAAGRGFDTQNRPKMLFEPHVFYRNLSGSLLSAAISAGMAYKSWRSNYPRDSYPRLTRAIDIALEPAFRSGSYGLPQILGENHKAAGFTSAASMFATMKKGEAEQLMAMVTLLESWGLAEKLVGKDFSDPNSWRAAASRYNGSGYAKHNYHGRLAQAFIKHSKGEPMVIATQNLERGTKGESVLALQKDLAVLGYVFEKGIDGRYGDETKANVRAFQKANGLVVDGKAGPKTLAALSKAVAAATVDHSPAPPEWPKKGIWELIMRIITAIIAAFNRKG